MSSHDELRAIALTEFATAGYAATSLQQIAERAGLSKSSVLYHYASKEALLEAAIGPAIDRMNDILDPIENQELSSYARRDFLSSFVDLLLEHRLEVHMFINQGPSLVDVPVIDRANALILRLAEFFAANSSSLEDKMRFGVALGGAAYMLCTVHTLDLEPSPVEETRAALLTILTELLAPVSVPNLTA
jgi:TetR/AcrR family transcriptional regulator